MNLIVTDPILEDYIAFHKLISEPKFQSEFINYRNQTIEATKQEINFWVKNSQKVFPSFFRVIRLTPHDNLSSYTRDNSFLIGFISNIQADQTDQLYSGFKMLINFGITEEYEGKGIMTMALEMTLEKLYEMKFSIVSAFVKPSNIASEKVLIKCGFDLLNSDLRGKTFVKALMIDKDEYKNSFGIN